MKSQKLSPFTRGVLLMALYCLGGMLGKASAFMSGRVELVWPQSGIALAAILLFGYRFWPGVAVGAVLFDLMNGSTLGWFTLGTVIGNTVGAVVCAYLLERFVRLHLSLDRVFDVAGFVGWACLLGTTVNAAFNVVGLCYAGRWSWDALGSGLVQWWVPNAMAGLVVTPFILTWGVPCFLRWRPALILEGVACGVGLLFGTLISFNSWYVYGLQNYPLAYLPYPFLVWGALRFGPRGATTGTLVVSAVAVHALLEMRGPFVARIEEESLLLIGTYIGILAVSNLLLAAAATEHARAEEALGQSEERFSKAFHASPVAIAIVGLEDHRFVDVNDHFLRLVGYERSEVVGRTDRDISLWPDPGRCEHVQGEVREGRAVRDREGQLRTRTGVARTVLTSAEGVSLAGRACVLFIHHDITERQHLETQVRQLQKMEAIGQLSAGVAHDFNNSLTVIQGYAKLLAEEPHLQPRIAEALAAILAAAERASLLTRQLLTFSRSQATQPQDLDVSELVQNTTPMLRRLLGEDVILTLNCSAQLPLVHADAGMLEQVLLNLALNSREAMPHGGAVTIATAQVEVELPYVHLHPEGRPGLFVTLTVTDTGCGIPPEDLPHIFEPFFTTKAVGKGTGLGLATVFGIVKQHQGWITVASEPARGTTFEIFLPGTPAKAGASPKEPPPTEAAHRRQTVLLVDDQDEVRGLARLVLEKHGYRVLEATSGTKALAVWADHAAEIDLLLTDMVMPEGTSGRQLADALLVQDPNLKVVYTSGYSEDLLDASMSLKEGFNFLKKPFYPQTLVGTVRRRLAQA